MVGVETAVGTEPPERARSPVDWTGVEG
jgi:hypothetical protein